MLMHILTRSTDKRIKKRREEKNWNIKMQQEAEIFYTCRLCLKSMRKMLSDDIPVSPLRVSTTWEKPENERKCILWKQNILFSSLLSWIIFYEFTHELDDWKDVVTSNVVSQLFQVKIPFCRSPPRVIFHLFFSSIWTFLEKHTILRGKLKIYLFSADLKGKFCTKRRKKGIQRNCLSSISYRTQNGKSNK